MELKTVQTFYTQTVYWIHRQMSMGKKSEIAQTFWYKNNRIDTSICKKKTISCINNYMWECGWRQWLNYNTAITHKFERNLEISSWWFGYTSSIINFLWEGYFRSAAVWSDPLVGERCITVIKNAHKSVRYLDSAQRFYIQTGFLWLTL